MNVIIKALLVGAGTVFLVLVIVLIAFAPIAHAAGLGDVRLSAGPILIYEYTRSANGFATSLGPGIVVVALLGGLLNAIVAGLIRRSDGLS
jgi:hypothetical protein